MQSHPIFAALYAPVTMPAEWLMLRSLRRRLLGALTGRVIDLGAGIGYSYFHLRAARRVVGVDPNPHLLSRSRRRAERAPVPVDLVVGDGRHLPFRDGSLDGAVVSLVLCSVPELAATLAEVRRVLGPGGRLAFIEHVRLAGLGGRIQDIVAPAWVRLAGGCRLNRRSLEALEEAGFLPERVEERLGGLLIAGLARSPAP